MMKNLLEGKIIRMRWSKKYKEASSHVLIGQVHDENSKYMIVEGKTFHFRKLISSSTGKGVLEGPLCLRAIPWDAIEVMHILPEKTDYSNTFTFDKNGDLVLDNKHKTLIARCQDFDD